MKAAWVGVIAAAILAVAMAAWAQKPDFSGAWTLDPSSAPAGGGDEGGTLGNGAATVKQTAETLTIQRPMGDDTVTLTYKLDGTGSRNVLVGRAGQIDSLSIVKWDGPKLTIVTKQEADGKLAEATEVWSVAGMCLRWKLPTGVAHRSGSTRSSWRGCRSAGRSNESRRVDDGRLATHIGARLDTEPSGDQHGQSSALPRPKYRFAEGMDPGFAKPFPPEFPCLTHILAYAEGTNGVAGSDGHQPLRVHTASIA